MIPNFLEVSYFCINKSDLNLLLLIICFKMNYWLGFYSSVFFVELMKKFSFT